MSVKMGFAASMIVVSVALNFLFPDKDGNNTRGEAEKQQSIESRMTTMTLEEKVGQMMIAGIDGTSFNTNTKTLIDQYKIGGFILYANNMKMPTQTVHLLNQIKERNAVTQIPLLLGIDQEGGRISRLPKEVMKLPSNDKIGKQDDSQISFGIGEALGLQLTSFGFNMNFAPVLDIASNPDNPVIGDRSFGPDSELVSKLGVQTMKGLQSQNVIPVVKHFPGHGDTSVDSHLDLPVVNNTRTELHKLELLPFISSFENGADAVMIAHILLPSIDADSPSSMSKPIITELLRKELGFDGVVMTDDMTMKAITKHYDIGKAAVDSVKAGSDIIMVAHDYEKIVAVANSLKQAVENGEMSEERVNASVKRILKLKDKYNIRDIQMDNPDIGQLNKVIKKRLTDFMK